MRRPRFRFNFGRLAHISLQNIGRNLFLSVATTVMLGLILFIFNVIMVLNVLTQSSLEQLADKVDLLIYLDESGSVYEISELISEIESIPVVTEVNYTSKEEALSEFLEDYPGGDDPFTAYGLSNPLPSNVQIKTADPSHHQMVIDYLEATPYSELLTAIESSNENQEIVTRLVRMTTFTKQLTVGVIVTFLFGALLMIMNAIHLSIYTRKLEVQIMQLVGAKPSMIRLPFLFEGGIYSVLAVLFSLVLLLAFLKGTNLIGVMNLQEHGYSSLALFGLELVGSLAIGVISSLIAINYYLKRNFILS